MYVCAGIVQQKRRGDESCGTWFPGPDVGCDTAMRALFLMDSTTTCHGVGFLDLDMDV